MLIYTKVYYFLLQKNYMYMFIYKYQTFTKIVAALHMQIDKLLMAIAMTK